MSTQDSSGTCRMLVSGKIILNVEIKSRKHISYGSESSYIFKRKTLTHAYIYKFLPTVSYVYNSSLILREEKK
jgi:hypothetical protein